MTSVLAQLDGNDAMLTLLAADELSPTDRQAALRQIAADPALAAEWEALRGTQAALHAALAALDAATPLPLSAPAAVRQFRQSVSARREREIALPALPAAVGRWHVQWWMYPTVAAAIVLVSLVTWWGWHNQDATGVASNTVAQSPAGAGGNTPAVAAGPVDGPAPVPPPMALALPIPPAPAAPPVSESSASPAETDDLAGEPGIADAEQQASTLQRRSDPSTITASIFLSDPSAPVE